MEPRKGLHQCPLTACCGVGSINVQRGSECQIYTPAQDLAEQALTKEQEELVGKGCAGPPITLDSVPLTNAQVSYVC